MTTLANINYGTAANLAELATLVDQAAADARALGHDPSTVYLNFPRVRLFERRLEDGSPVLDCAVTAE